MCLHIARVSTSRPNERYRQPIRGLAWCHHAKANHPPRAPPRRYSNQVYKWKWIALYTFCYVYTNSRSNSGPKYSIERRMTEAAFVWTFDSLDWLFRDIIIYVDDSRLVHAKLLFLEYCSRILYSKLLVKNSLYMSIFVDDYFVK